MAIKAEKGGWNVPGMFLQGFGVAVTTYAVAWLLGHPGLFAASAGAGAAFAIVFRGHRAPP